MTRTTKIPGRLESAATGNVVAGANSIIDDGKGKKQNVINSEVDAELVRLDQNKQNNLTFDNSPTEGSDNPVKSGGVYAADKALSDAIEAILLLIPSAASALNQLADKNFVNSSISTATATPRGTYNLVSDLDLTTDATRDAIAEKLGEVIDVADLNDYAFVQVPVSDDDPTEIERTERYKFNGDAWIYEYTLNTSGFTAAQWEAINSGITAALVAKLDGLPTAAALELALGTITQNIQNISAVIPTEATALNQLADKAYVLAQILAATPSFKGQFTTLAQLQDVTGAKAGDLSIVRTKDSDGHDVFTFYQYLDDLWNEYFVLSYHPQDKPATTGWLGNYPYNGMGRVELPKNMVDGWPDNTWVYLPKNDVVYLLYSWRLQLYAVYNVDAQEGLGLDDNLVVKPENYDIADLDEIVDGRYLSFTENGGVWTIEKPDESTITSTELNNTNIYHFNDPTHHGINVLTQEMLNRTNTIYVIQYDYDLNGQTITVPENCILEFDGGSLSNGAIDANNCDVKGEPKFSLTNVGLFKDRYYDLSWFTVPNNDYSSLLQNIVNASYTENDTTSVYIFVPEGEFIISNLFVASQGSISIEKKARFTLKGIGKKSVINVNGGTGIKLVKEFLLEDIAITGGTEYPALTLGKQGTYNTQGNSTINRCAFYGNSAGAIDSTDFLIDLNITNCFFTENNNENGAVCRLQGNSSTTFRVTKCYFSNNNQAKYALYLNGNTNINIVDNIFESSGLILYCYSCNFLNIDGNYFEYATDYYIDVKELSFVVRIANNFFRYSVVDMPYIRLRNQEEIFIENNKFEGWNDGYLPSLRYFDIFNIANLVCRNNSYEINDKIATRYENNDVNIIRPITNKKLYSSFQNGSADIGYPSSDDPNNYIEFIDNFGFADNYSYKICVRSRLMTVPNTNFQFIAGKRYVLSLYLKKDPSSTINKFSFHITGTYSAGSTLIKLKDDSWKRYQFDFIAKQNADLSIYIGNYNYATNLNCVFYIDDIQIEEKEVGYAGEYMLTGGLQFDSSFYNTLLPNGREVLCTFQISGDGWYRVLKSDKVPLLLTLCVAKLYTYTPQQFQFIVLGTEYSTNHKAYSFISSPFDKFRIVKIGDFYYLDVHTSITGTNTVCCIIRNCLVFGAIYQTEIVKDGTYDSVYDSNNIVNAGIDSGTTSLRPTNVVQGYKYYDTNIQTNIYAKSINNGVVTWVEYDGAPAGVKRNGTFAERPAVADVYTGFQYFNRDTQMVITRGNDLQWHNPDGTVATQ